MQKKKEKKKKKGGLIIFIIAMIIFAGLLTLALLFFNQIHYNPEKEIKSIEFDPSIYRGYHVSIKESILEELSIRLEPFDEECIDAHQLCLDGCSDDFDICDDDLLDCYDVCDETYSDDDEFETCCIGCEETYVSPCLTTLFSCAYTCVEDCEIEEEIVEWSGEDIDDIGNFYQTSFPIFSFQFQVLCEDFGGTFVSTPDKFGCTDFWFIIIPIAENSRSIISSHEVCTTIGKTWIQTNEDVSCNN